MSLNFTGLEQRVKRAAKEQPEEIKNHIRQLIGTMKPRDRRDWQPIDRVMAAVTILSHRTNETYSELIDKAVAGDTSDAMVEQLYRCSTYRAALTVMELTHARFVLEGVYRDDNADWYGDRLMSAIEGALAKTHDERIKLMEAALAKARRAD